MSEVMNSIEFTIIVDALKSSRRESSKLEKIESTQEKLQEQKRGQVCNTGPVHEEKKGRIKKCN